MWDPFLDRSQGFGDIIDDNSFDEDVEDVGEVGDTLETRNSYSVFPRPDTMADLATDLVSGLRSGRKKEGIYLDISTIPQGIIMFSFLKYTLQSSKMKKLEKRQI